MQAVRSLRQCLAAPPLGAECTNTPCTPAAAQQLLQQCQHAAEQLLAHTPWPAAVKAAYVRAKLPSSILRTLRWAASNQELLQQDGAVAELNRTLLRLMSATMSQTSKKGGPAADQGLPQMLVDQLSPPEELCSSISAAFTPIAAPITSPSGSPSLVAAHDTVALAQAICTFDEQTNMLLGGQPLQFRRKVLAAICSSGLLQQLAAALLGVMTPSADAYLVPSAGAAVQLQAVRVAGRLITLLPNANCWTDGSVGSGAALTPQQQQQLRQQLQQEGTLVAQAFLSLPVLQLRMVCVSAALFLASRLHYLESPDPVVGPSGAEAFPPLPLKEVQQAVAAMASPAHHEQYLQQQAPGLHQTLQAALTAAGGRDTIIEQIGSISAAMAVEFLAVVTWVCQLAGHSNHSPLSTIDHSLLFVFLEAVDLRLLVCDPLNSQEVLEAFVYAARCAKVDSFQQIAAATVPTLLAMAERTAVLVQQEVADGDALPANNSSSSSSGGRSSGSSSSRSSQARGQLGFSQPPRMLTFQVLMTGMAQCCSLSPTVLNTTREIAASGDLPSPVYVSLLEQGYGPRLMRLMEASMRCPPLAVTIAPATVMCLPDSLPAMQALMASPKGANAALAVALTAGKWLRAMVTAIEAVAAHGADKQAVSAALAAAGMERSPAAVWAGAVCDMSAGALLCVLSQFTRRAAPMIMYVFDSAFAWLDPALLASRRGKKSPALPLPQGCAGKAWEWEAVLGRLRQLKQPYSTNRAQLLHQPPAAEDPVRMALLQGVASMQGAAAGQQASRLANAMQQQQQKEQQQQREEDAQREEGQQQRGTSNILTSGASSNSSSSSSAVTDLAAALHDFVLDGLASGDKCDRESRLGAVAAALPDPAAAAPAPAASGNTSSEFELSAALLLAFWKLAAAIGEVQPRMFAATLKLAYAVPAVGAGSRSEDLVTAGIHQANLMVCCWGLKPWLELLLPNDAVAKMTAAEATMEPLIAVSAAGGPHFVGAWAAAATQQLAGVRSRSSGIGSSSSSSLGGGAGPLSAADAAVMSAAVRDTLSALGSVALPYRLGCANPACLNLTGSSEAALPTRGCSACQGPKYCGRGCQVAHWKAHKAACQAAQAAAKQAAAAAAAAGGDGVSGGGGC